MAAALKAEDILTPEQLIQAVLDGPTAHVCQTKGWMFDTEIQSATALTRNAELFFQSPATVMLYPNEIQTRKEKDTLFFDQKYSSSNEKMPVLMGARAELEKYVKSSSFIDELVAATDELVTNSLFNAPFVDPITFHNARVDRLTTVVNLPPEKASRLFLAQDGQRLVIGVEDLFGSLDVQGYLKRISACYGAGVRESINFEQGGAGIGSYIVFDTAASLYYGVKPGKKTIVACVIPFKASRRQRDGMPKHLHWIQAK